MTREPVTFERDTHTLMIGDRSAVVPDPAAGNEAVLHSYLALVAEVRGTPIGSGIEVRHDDVVVLAEILDLTDTDLEVHLANLLGVSAKDAADVHRRIRWHHALVAAATLAFGGLTYTTVDEVSAATTPVPVVSAAMVGVTTSEPGTTTITIAEAPPASPPPAASHAHPRPSDDVQIGDALVIVRGEQPADPNTQVGDAVTYER